MKSGDSPQSGGVFTRLPSSALGLPLRGGWPQRSSSWCPFAPKWLIVSKK